MERRAFLTALSPLVVLPGCVDDGSGRPSETEPPAPEPNASDSTTTEPTETEPTATTDECGWPQFCEGSTMVEVSVSASFSGDVVLVPGCRDEEVAVQPGETVTVTREVDAEECDVTLYVDDEEVYSRHIPDYESTTLEVDADGAVHEETMVL